MNGSLLVHPTAVGSHTAPSGVYSIMGNERGGKTKWSNGLD